MLTPETRDLAVQVPKEILSTFPSFPWPHEITMIMTVTRSPTETGKQNSRCPRQKKEARARLASAARSARSWHPGTRRPPPTAPVAAARVGVGGVVFHRTGYLSHNLGLHKNVCVDFRGPSKWCFSSCGPFKPQGGTLKKDTLKWFSFNPKKTKKKKTRHAQKDTVISRTSLSSIVGR